MRKRDLIKKLNESRIELSDLARSGLFPPLRIYRQNAERRLALLHELESLLPEIVKRLRERQP